MKTNRTKINNIYDNKYINKANVGTLHNVNISGTKTNFYYLRTHDNIPLFEYLYDYTYDNNNNYTETGKLIDFNLIPVLIDKIGNFYVTKQTYFYVLIYNEYDLELNKNNKKMNKIKENISKIDKNNDLIHISKILYENRINIIIYHIEVLNKTLISKDENQRMQIGYKSFLVKAKNAFTLSSIDENIKYLLDKLYFIHSTINNNSLLFYKNSQKVNNYFKNKIHELLKKKFIMNYFSIKEEENEDINIQLQSGGEEIIKNNLSNKQIFINFLTNIHIHDNKYFRGLELLNMENSVDAIKNYYVKNKLTDIEYRDALKESNIKYKEIINSNYLQLSRYLNYFFPKEGKFAYEYINLKNARKFLFLKKIFPTNFLRVFNLFNSLLDTEIVEILKVIEFKNKNLKQKQNIRKKNTIINFKKQKQKQKIRKNNTIINLNRMKMSNIKSELFKFLSNPTIFNFNGLNIYPLLLFQQYPDIFHQYYPKYYESINSLDDNTFNELIEQINIPTTNNLNNV